ncbi:adenine phosphoribosyltransferase [Leptobacterium sp. I13]|uniref:adenine phosphoribosyltransferase n=1 Tax=Leptobacterium meishanense TaxID=3128904 RepID=UPI0030EE1978
MNIENYIRDIQDFPKQGIVFKDITPLLKNPLAFKYTTISLLNLVGNKQVDKVVGMETRGFFFATLMAQELNAGFVPVRKPNKLPSKTIQETYALEYGTDTLEIHADAISPGDKILIHDDVLATGGTAKATCKLVERLGGEIVQCNFLIELVALNGRNQLEGIEAKSLLTY